MSMTKEEYDCRKDCWIQDRCNRYKKGECDNPNCEKYIIYEMIYSNSQLSKEQWNPVKMTLNDNSVDNNAFNRVSEISKSIDKFVKNGGNLILFSSRTGNGKTSWAIKLLHSYVDKTWTDSSPHKSKILFIDLSKFLYAMKQNISSANKYYNEVMANVEKADLVVWDEIGNKDLTDYEMNNLIWIINSRLDQKKANIFTTNMTPELLKSNLGNRIWSRVYAESEKIEFKETDRRGVTVK